MRILFVTSTRLGDAVLSTGALAWLLDRHRGASATVACGAVPAPLFHACPGVDRVVPITKRRYNGHWLRLWTEVAAEKWDLVVDLRGSALSWLLRTRRRIVHRPDSSARHRVVQIAELVGAAEPASPRLWIDEDARKASDRALPPGGTVLALGPTASWEPKRWPVDRFAELALRLTDKSGPLPDARIAIFGASSEREGLAGLFASLPRERTIDLVGKLELTVVAACLARADLFVGNDSGLMHIAAALGAPTLGLFGPSATVHYAPWGERAAAVRTPQSYEELAPRFDAAKAAGETLMSGLSVATVEAAAARLLQRMPAPSPA